MIVLFLLIALLPTPTAPYQRPPPPVQTPYCANRADLNCDGVVDIDDFVIFNLAWEAEDDGNPDFNPACDFNDDHIVNSLDFVVFKRGYGR